MILGSLGLIISDLRVQMESLVTKDLLEIRAHLESLKTELTELPRVCQELKE